MASPRPLSTRKLDFIYLIFFIIHIPVMLLVDLGTYYPPSIRPAIVTSIRSYYVTDFRDRFFIDPPLWFHAYTALELLYHLPISIWMIGALRRDHPMVSVNLVVFGMLTSVTTLTCAVEMVSWDGYTTRERGALLGLYLPYLALALLMVGDGFLRLQKVIGEYERLTTGKKKL